MRLSARDRVVLYLGSGQRAASEVGAYLWPSPHRRGCASHGGGYYAAQMLLGRLRKRGLVRVAHGPGSSRWELTESGTRRCRVLRSRGASP